MEKKEIRKNERYRNDISPNDICRLIPRVDSLMREKEIRETVREY